MEENVFEVIDKFGYTIVCPAYRWRYLSEKHDEFEGRSDDVSNVVSSPDVVYASITHPENRYVACKDNEGAGKRYTKVVVQVTHEYRTGSITTAYTSKEIGGENIDTTKRLYP